MEMQAPTHPSGVSVLITFHFSHHLCWSLSGKWTQHAQISSTFTIHGFFFSKPLSVSEPLFLTILFRLFSFHFSSLISLSVSLTLSLSVSISLSLSLPLYVSPTLISIILFLVVPFLSLFLGLSSS